MEDLFLSTGKSEKERTENEVFKRGFMDKVVFEAGLEECKSGKHNGREL